MTQVHINAGNNRSILVAATEKEKIEFVRLILEKGANPNVATSDTCTIQLTQWTPPYTRWSGI